jgi:hypothetical protein
MNGHLLDAVEASALAEKQKHWALIKERLREKRLIDD